MYTIEKSLQTNIAHMLFDSASPPNYYDEQLNLEKL